MAMIEKWRKFLDIGGHAGALFTDLSKAFDFIDHELLIAKLHAYDFETDAVKFIYSYLKGRKQRTKINSSYSSFAETLFGVPQGSIFGPLLFNAYICDLFFDIDVLDFASFADGNTPYSCLLHMISVLGQSKGGIDKIFGWFKKNVVKENADKCHLITSSKTPVGTEVSNITIMTEEKVKLLGIYIDNRLNFRYHISQFCKKTGEKLNISQGKLIANAFIMSQFSYYPLIWMFHSRDMEHRINRIHERTLRLIYPNQHQLTFKKLLEKKKTVSIHQRNLQTLATEIYKAKNKIFPEVVNSLLEFTNKNYNLRNASILKRKRYFTVHYGSESIASLAPTIWELVPDSVRVVKTSIFKNKTKTDKCQFRLCKNYIGQVGFIHSCSN